MGGQLRAVGDADPTGAARFRCTVAQFESANGLIRPVPKPALASWVFLAAAVLVNNDVFVAAVSAVL
jgi:hypothetical protein